MPTSSLSPPRLRLDQVHELWHRALDAYPIVDDFVLSINALLQAERTVTWVLQKWLRHKPWFDDWYVGREAVMSADPVMRWLVKARNHVEKEGDLDMRSSALVSVIDSWLEVPYLEVDVPPLVPTTEIARVLRPRELPEHVRRDGIFRVERRWIASSLPDMELLDATAHGFAVLNSIVTEAEAIEAGGQPSDSAGAIPIALDCMFAGPDERTANLNLRTDDFVAFERESVPPVAPHDLVRVADRYSAAIDSVGRAANSLPGRISWHHELGRKVLEIDGYHHTVMFTIRAGKELAANRLVFNDQQEKYLVMDAISREVAAKGIDEVIVSGEMWFAEALAENDPLSRVRPGDRNDRSEGFGTYGANRDGEFLTLLSAFERVEDQIVLSEPEASDFYPNALDPIRRVWERGKARSQVQRRPKAR
jgi:hypothetical protein